MREQLIKLAKEKGFIPDTLSTSNFKEHPEDFNSESIVYYLWLCELQKWLMDKHGIIVTIELDTTLEPKYVFILSIYKNNNWLDEGKISDLYYTYNDSLEDGCFEALKLIN